MTRNVQTDRVAAVATGGNAVKVVRDASNRDVQMMAIASQSDADTDVIGDPTDAPWSGSGDGALLAILKRAAADPATQTTLAAVLAKQSGDPSTATLQSAGNSTLASILTALQASRAETLWTDDTGAFFVRVDSGGTISWKDVSGNTSAAPGTGARPAAGEGLSIDVSRYQATGSGTGYSVADLIDHYLTLDPFNGAIIGNFWYNTTTGAKITAPSSSNISPLSPLPTGAATSAKQDTQHTDLINLLTQIVLASGTNVIGKVGIDQTTDGTSNAVSVKGQRLILAASTQLVRPTNTTTYAANDEVSASSPASLSVTVSDTNDAPVALDAIRVSSTDTGFAGTQLRVWAYNAATTAGTDNAAFSTTRAGYIGTFTGTLRATSDGCVGTLTPDEGARYYTTPQSGAKTIQLRVQTLGAPVPSANSTTFDFTVQGFQGRA